MDNKYLCLFCQDVVGGTEIEGHKNRHHKPLGHYGFMWPLSVSKIPSRDLWDVPTYESSILAEALGVGKVYIRDEGQNFSGSMKDYSVERAVMLGLQDGFGLFFVVSSGNHAVSLAKYAKKNGAGAVVFAPASSSKLAFLSSLPDVLAVGVEGAIFEDVYTLVADMSFEEIYNANVSNELLLPGFCPVANQVVESGLSPDYVIAGVGNGSYLAGFVLGFDQLSLPMPRIIPVGMQGAFPTERAFAEEVLVREYDDFLVMESTIDAAEGSIAIASYSMPQLIQAIRLSDGFPLGGLTNQDLREAYLLLSKDDNLIEKGVIPEPTGIMGLGAAIKHQRRFGSSDTLLIAFTGHGVKDVCGIRRLVPEISDRLIESARSSRPDLITNNENDVGGVIFVDKGISVAELKDRIITRTERMVVDD
ncbi:pyridoxal-phosphate dependent enzyme [Candidatus Falkowbacteria bacterium]|nr:pyridoxal-phosphate dependent enzyme [Candidatus Falkowbacteria bacterium]